MITPSDKPSNIIVEYNGIIIVLFVACIVIATIAFIGLIFALRKRIKIKNGKAVNTQGNAATIALLIPLIIGCINGSIFIGIGYRATNKDIDIDLDQKISLNMTFDVYAREDINNLELTFEFKNKKGTILSTKIKNVGDLQRGKTYQVPIKLTEFDLSEIVSIYSVSAEVTGGRISYFYHTTT